MTERIGDASPIDPNLSLHAQAQLTRCLETVVHNVGSLSAEQRTQLRAALLKFEGTAPKHVREAYSDAVIWWLSDDALDQAKVDRLRDAVQAHGFRRECESLQRRAPIVPAAWEYENGGELKRQMIDGPAETVAANSRFGASVALDHAWVDVRGAYPRHCRACETSEADLIGHPACDGAPPPRAATKPASDALAHAMTARLPDLTGHGFTCDRDRQGAGNQ